MWSLAVVAAFADVGHDLVGAQTSMDTANAGGRPSALGLPGRHVSPTTAGLVGAGRVWAAVERVLDPVHARLVSGVGPVALPTYSPGTDHSCLRRRGSRRRRRGHRWRLAECGRAARGACRPGRDSSKHRCAFRGGVAGSHPHGCPGAQVGQTADVCVDRGQVVACGHARAVDLCSPHRGCGSCLS
jgi:hypothetical protein